MEYIAHRGKTIKFLENTVEAFVDAAKDSHFDGIECDVYTTLDHEFVIHHDHNFLRLAQDERHIMDVTYQELESINLVDQKNKTYKVPHLVEFLNICKTYKKRPIIEIKEIHDITLLHQLITLLDDYMEISPTIISFNINYLKYLRTISHIDLYFLTTEITEQFMYDCRVNEINFNINKESLSKETISILKKKGFKVGVFTVNEQDIENNCKKLNVEFITTDCL